MTNDRMIGKAIGIVTEIIDDKKINCIINNEVKCNIADIIAVKYNEVFFLAQIAEIKVEFYLENTRQYFVSKAVDNVLLKITDSTSKPRYAQHAIAQILGCYKLNPDGIFSELKDQINRFTPVIFQKVFLIDFEKIVELYGLGNSINFGDSDSLEKTISLGRLSFPKSLDGNELLKEIHFNINSFKRHTLITGVTGSGKSRFAGLLIKELASIGAHVSILDPHNEYTSILENGNGYDIYQFDDNNLIFNIKNINAIILTKLIPTLSEQQEIAIYEIFKILESEKKGFENFLITLIKELNLELITDYPNRKEQITDIYTSCQNLYRSKVTDFVKSYTKSLKQITDFSRSNRSNVLIAVLQKVNELFETGMLSQKVPNWLSVSPNSIDIFNLDYNSNSYVRRFVNSILQYFVRIKSEDKIRILVIDEVHLLLNETLQTTQLIKQLLREARKFNVSVIFISQNNDDISEDIRTQFQNQFIFRSSNFEITKYFPDKICHVSLYGSKSTFAMRVNDVRTLSEEI